MEPNKLSPDAALRAQQKSGRIKLLLVLAVCAFPLLGSYFTYYVIKPTGRTNYGDLIDSQAHPMPVLSATTLDGQPATLAALQGKWIMLQAAPADCPELCQKQLFAMQQLRTMQGKERERIERVWLVSDAAPLETQVIREFDGTTILRAPAATLAAWLPVEAGGSMAEHIYLIDPRGNLMMRFPKNPDPAKVSKDLGKLLKASAIG